MISIYILKVLFTRIKKLSIQLVSIIGMLILSISCQPGSPNSEQSDSDVKLESKTKSVEIVNPTKESFKAEILISGKAMPNQQVMIKAMENGRLKSIRKDIGDHVNNGEVIAVLDNPNIVQLVSDAESALEIGYSNLTTIQSQLKASEADLQAKEAIYSRLKDIYVKTPQLTTISDMDKVEGEARMAHANKESALAMVKAQKRQIQALEKRLVIAKMKRAMLSIKAPFAGVITHRYMDVGTMVQSGINDNNALPIVELQDINPIRLSLPIPESDAGAIRKGMPVKVDFPELAGGSLECTISRTSGSLDPSSNTMTVEIDIPNKEEKILSGMYAKAQIQVASRDNVLSLPVTSQIMHQDQPYLLTVNDGIVHRKLLKKGLSNKNSFEVLNGDIDENTQVIIKGKSLVKPGDTVNAISKIR